MNQLVIPNGGMPLEGDDFRWLQDGIKAGIKGLLRDLEKRQPFGVTFEGIILQGCEITDGPTTFSVSEGYVLIDGEVCYAPPVAAIPNASKPQMYYRLRSSFDPSGDEIFQDTVQRSTYEIRDAELAFINASVPYPIVQLDQPYNRFSNIITVKDVKSLYDLNAEGSVANGWTVVGQATPDIDLLVTKQFGRVNIRGQIVGGTLGSIAFTLSAGFRPVVVIEALCKFGTDGIAAVTILPNGNVTVTAIVSPTASGIVDLSNINFTIE